MDNKLDQEFKRYLQILRPYLGQLASEDAIKICNEWIKRLSNCNEEEKPLRNKYIFMLCYQLAKGILDAPFLGEPPTGELCAITDIVDSDSSTEMEYVVIDEDDENGNVLYNNTSELASRTDLDLKKSHSQQQDSTKGDTSSKNVDFMRHMCTPDDSSETTRKQTVLCYNCPILTRDYEGDVTYEPNPEHYEYRANNLIMKLREIKKQNMLLHKEIEMLKEECKERQERLANFSKVDNSTCTYGRLESNTMLNSIKVQLQEAEEDKKRLMQALDSLHGELQNKDDIMKHEIEDLETKHNMELFKVKTSLREKNKVIYDERINELRDHYEQIIRELKEDNVTEIENVIKSKNKVIADIEKTIQVRNKELQDKNYEIEEKTLQLSQKEAIIAEKNAEISHLKSQIEEQKADLNSIFNRFLDKSNEDLSAESMKIKAQELGQRLNKMEKSRMKCLKACEVKLASLQREKHIMECSMQIQFVKQRAQIVNEMTAENQAETSAALNKLEAKYKEIIANVQSMAIQRRKQDEVAINTILKAACSCGLRSEVFTNQSQLSGKSGNTTTMRVNKECIHSGTSDLSGIHHERSRQNRSFGEDSVGTGYCLRGDQLNELLDKLYVPQRDLDASLPR